MDALQKALAQIEQGESEQRGDHPDHFSRAVEYAAVAQAEAATRSAAALERIADVLDGWRIQLVENPEAIKPRRPNPFYKTTPGSENAV